MILPRLAWLLVCAFQASCVILGGSGLLRTDGTLQLGVRKLISEVRGLAYDSDWLPRVVEPTSVPVWLCREGIDDPLQLLLQYVKVRRPAGTVRVRAGPSAC